MDKRTWDRVGEDFAPGGRDPAPGSLHLVQRFLNTRNHEFSSDWDRLGSSTSARSWLVDSGLMAADEQLREADRLRLVAFRDALRSLAMASAGVRLPAGALAALNGPAGACLRLRFGLDGRPVLEPAMGGVDGAMGRILAAGYRAWLDGTWGRLKGCAQCGWAFYDRSRNRSARWCSMSICGNRTKNRVYRRRRMDQPGARLR